MEKASSYADIVYGNIVRRILTGEYRPGQVVNRREVAQSLNVSISPVNEAFAVLQSEGLIVTLPRKGTFIASLDWRDIGDLTDLRSALECQAARSFKHRVDEEGIARLIVLARTVDGADANTYEHLTADVRFHRELVASAGNIHLDRAFGAVITRSLLLAIEAMLTIDSEIPHRLSHERMVQDLQDATPSEAENIVRRNIYPEKRPILRRSSEARRFAEEPETTLDLVLSFMNAGQR